MKITLLLLAICLTLGLVWSSENEQDKGLEGRTIFGIVRPKPKRSPYMPAKGGVKVHPLFEFRRTTPEPELRKGEYVCDDKVCKLKPGQIPKGCNGMCQHAID